MKKNYVSLLTGCFFALGLNLALAQSPTITTANLPVVGTAFGERADSTAGDLPNFTVTAGSASAQSWNYSTQFVNTYTTGINFASPSGLPGASSFPSANLGETNAGTSVFFTTNSSGLSIDGYYANFGTGIGYVTVPYTGGELVIPTPFTYGNSRVNSFSSTYSVSTTYSSTTYTSKNVQHSTRTLTADAFGSLTTPAGTYGNTLRIKAYQVNIDTQFVYLGANASGTPISTTPSRDSSLDYEWVQNGTPVLLMEIDMNGAGTSVTGANYTTGVTTGIVSLPSAFASLSLYPNPATVATSFTYENKYATHVSIDLFDLSGRLITNLANENQSAGQQTLPIDTKALGLNAGLYFIRISGTNGSETLKLNVD